MKTYNANKNLVTLSNSILKRFNVPTYHETIKEVDDILKNHKKIVVFLFDGMGKALLNRHKDVAKNLLNHSLMTITSVNPPTTVAATTAFLSGRYPIETGWLGWSLSFKNLNRIIDVFPNKDSITGEEIDGPNIMNKNAPYENIIQLINKNHNKEIAFQLMEKPIFEDGPENIEDGFRLVKEKLDTVEEGFVYCYITAPDHNCHEFGIDHDNIKEDIKRINDGLSKFADENKDILCIAIADHGHINIKPVFLDDYPDLTSLLKEPMSLEGRTPSFKVKDGQEKLFKELFKKHFKDSYELFSKQEILDMNFFGKGTPKQLSIDFIGDFIGVCNDDTLLLRNREFDFFKGHHAGGTKEELEIDIIVYNA